MSSAKNKRGRGRPKNTKPINRDAIIAQYLKDNEKAINKLMAKRNKNHSINSLRIGAENTLHVIYKRKTDLINDLKAYIIGKADPDLGLLKTAKSQAINKDLPSNSVRGGLRALNFKMGKHVFGDQYLKSSTAKNIDLTKYGVLGTGDVTEYYPIKGSSTVLAKVMATPDNTSSQYELYIYMDGSSL